MKMTYILLTVGLLQISAAGIGQTPRFSMKADGMTIKDVIQYIEQRTDYTFAYNNEEIDLGKKVTGVFSNMLPMEILEKVLKPNGIAYRVAGSQIILSPAEKKKTDATVKSVEIQSFTVTGTVTEENGTTMPGVNVVEKGTINGTVTDAEGRYSLKVTGESSVLTFSFLGYATVDMAVGNRRKIDVVLKEDATSIDEVVVVAYGTQKKESVTAAISTVQTRELKQSSAANLSAALAGRLPGLTTMQTSGQPGVDNVTLYLRGVGTFNDASPLILIDGVPRDNISVLDPNEVASVSILKDASATAVFGVRGANGAILITTRRGIPGKAELSVSVDQSWQKFTGRPTRLHSWEFAELRNQATLNDAPNTKPEDLPFTPYMIEKYKDGSDRVFYPDRDVFHEYFRDWTPQTRINANLNGGTDKVTYFLNIGVIDQSGSFKTESEKFLGYDPSYKMNRYSFRGNLDIKLANNLKMALNIGTYLQKTNSPQTIDLFNSSNDEMINNMMAYAWSTPPTDVGPLTIDGYGVPAGEVLNQSGQDRNTYGEVNRRGYRQATTTNLNSSLSLEWGLGFILKGLSAKGMISFDAVANTDVQGVRAYDTYSWTVAKNIDETSHYGVIRGNQNIAIRLAKSWNSTYKMNFQGSLNYSRNFGRNAITAMALFQRDNYIKTSGLPYNVIGTVGRLTYGYDDRYLAEFNMGYNGTEQFAPANRFGFFPSVSVGWVATKENFLKENKILTNLKIRASYGQVGNDKMGDTRFLYQDNIGTAGGFIPSLGRGQSISQGLMANNFIQWEVAVKKNIGLDFELFKQFSVTADYFWEDRSKILLTRRTVPVLQGVPLGNIPKVNMGEMSNNGFEIEATYQKVINSDLSLSVKGNYAYNRNKIIMIDEPVLDDTYKYSLRSTGYSRDQAWGYLLDKSNGNGYINTAEELEWAKKTYAVGGTPRMGDLIFQDISGDGVIDERDYAPLGTGSVPRITFGLSASVNYKNFDFSFLLTGMAGAERMFNGWGATETGLVGFYSDWHLHAWTAERYANGEKIEYPALATSGSTSQKANEFFMFDRTFLRLKNAEIGYSLPQRWIEPLNISKVRVYVNGNNLLTFDRYPIHLLDPEQNEPLKYPLIMMVNVGANIVF